MLGWAMEMGASQPAIAEHAKPTLSDEQQGVLTQALINVNTTRVHGVTISTVLLRCVLLANQAQRLQLLCRYNITNTSSVLSVRMVSSRVSQQSPKMHWT